MSQLNIVFAHSNIAQFRVLHEYLNESGLARSFLLCSEANFKKHSQSLPNLVPFKVHGNKLKSKGSFYYLTRVESANRRSLGILDAFRELQATTPFADTECTPSCLATLPSTAQRLHLRFLKCADVTGPPVENGTFVFL